MRSFQERIGSAPEGICRGQAKLPEMKTIALNDLVSALDSLGIRDVRITPVDDRIRYRRYVHEDGTEVLMLVNEGTGVYRGTVMIRDAGEQLLYAYDAWNNTLQSVKRAGNEVTFSLEPLHSLTLVLDAGAKAADLNGKTEEAAEYYTAAELSFSGSWVRDCCRSIDYPAFAGEKEIALPDHLAEEAPKFSGFVRYRNCFAAERPDCIFLEITDAHEGVEVFVNGESLGIQIVPPFCYELTGKLKDGSNELTIEVATTLERENSGKPDVLGQIHEPAALSGITGNIILRKVL